MLTIQMGEVSKNQFLLCNYEYACMSQLSQLPHTLICMLPKHAYVDCQLSLGYVDQR
jgi:hypothetical protein